MGEQGFATGSIARASAVLAALADERDGASLSLVIARTEFTKTTAHRTLQSLLDVEYVYQDPETRRYHLGSALGRLARQAGRSDVSAIAGRSMRRLADASEDTVFLSIPEGSEAICVRVELGAFPIRTLSLEVGDRVPLGVGATGQALYAATSQAETSGRCCSQQELDEGLQLHTAACRRSGIRLRGSAATHSTHRLSSLA